MDPQDAEELLRVAHELVRQNIGDRIYEIRSIEGQGWEGPRVTKWSWACQVLDRLTKKYPEPKE